MVNNHHIMNETFQKEQNELLNYYTNTYLWPKTKKKYGYHITREGLELIIRPECNQKCEYCYITQHGDKLYPKRLNKKETLHNVDLFLDYFYNTKKNYTRQIQLFAGDLFYDDIFFDILNLFDKYFKIVKKEEPEIFEFPTVITIPSNLAFVYEKPEKAKKVLKFIKYFEEQYFTRIMFSWSTDGLFCVDSREQKALTQEYFDTIFLFCKEARVAAHPMIAASNIAHWKENYDWWLEMYAKHNLSSGYNDFQPMMLEVRNNDWTEESITHYKAFLSYLMEKRIAMFENDIYSLTEHLFQTGTMNYDPLALTVNGEDILHEKLSCDLQSFIHINCTNLSLVLCHRLTYNLFTGGYFITDENNEKIISLKAHNVPGYLALKTTKNSQLPVCFTCLYKDFCIKGCLGAQYEASGEILLPAENMCKLMKEKFKHLIKLYNDYGILDCALQNDFLNNQQQNKIFRILREELREEIKYYE